MRLSHTEYAAFAFPQLLPSLIFPLTRRLQHKETHPGLPKWHPVSCAHRTHTSTHPRKTLGTQNPNIQLPRDLSAWDNNTAPAFMWDHKTVLFARLHLLVVPFPCQSSPSSQPQQLSRVCPPCSALVSTHTINLSASGGTGKL